MDSGAVFMRSGEESKCISSVGRALPPGLSTVADVDGLSIAVDAGRVAADTALFSLPHFVETVSVIITVDARV